ncbi:hypothetical protein ACLKA6_020007 [Drosophila palustris]
MDQEIAINCPDVDVVIGGHSHSFLYTGKPPSTDKPEGDYPTTVVRANGQKVPVLQAYAYTKYLGIRGSIEKKSDGVITKSDILTVIPFDNDLYITSISGKTIWNALEHAAAVIFSWTDGAFLQVSGLHVVYNSDMPEGSRVVSVDVRCASCTVPSYSPLSETEYYKVIVTQFLLEGGDGHIMIDEANPTRLRMQKTVVEAVTQYLQHHKFVYPELDGRITFKEVLEVHNNDMHARYDPMKGSDGKCPKGDDERGLCFGGFARVATAVAKARAERPTLYLNAGDTYQGTPWYTVYKGDLAADLMNMLNPDAVSLGSHELDDNIDGLLPFLNKVNFPIVSCNLDLSKAPQLQNAKNLMPSTIITKLEKQIGIIGYLTPETKDMVAVNDIEYYDEIPSINAEAKKLIEKGVNIIIALGHSGYKMDQEIAINCPDVDVVIGGHSHTFLFTGKPPSTDKPEGNYPTIVAKANGRRVPVLQAYAYTKYLGKIHLEFDNGGNLINFKGSPILLNSSVELESNMKSLLDFKRKKIDELDGQVVGTTKVLLNGDRKACRKKECNFGNFICDTLVYARVAEGFGGLYWTDASIALFNGGGIRASIDAGTDGTVTGADIATVLPYGNTISVARVKGASLVKSLEHSASLRNSDSDGGFLQVSGLRCVPVCSRIQETVETRPSPSTLAQWRYWRILVVLLLML